MTRTGWNRRRIALALYPFGAGAMAVSVFFASLTGPWIGLPVLSTLASILIGAVIGWPAAWWLAGHVSGLTDETDP